MKMNAHHKSKKGRDKGHGSYVIDGKLKGNLHHNHFFLFVKISWDYIYIIVKIINILVILFSFSIL